MTNEGTDQIATPALPPDARALLGFLLSYANGRSEFSADIDEDLLPKLDRCTRARFCALVRKLCRADLVVVDGDRWMITAPGIEPAKLRANVRFTIPCAIPHQYWKRQ